MIRKLDEIELLAPAKDKQCAIAAINSGADAVYIGRIEAISNATGAQYSIVPQDNATGNFVKVEQRLPVKIRFTADNTPESIQRLRAGLNVECEMIGD